ncbi:MAG: outer membrane protein assembly factor BamA [Phycisphaerae bacterium]|nr:outer membrane protein assembly factor BamA [Phycisphaerae bacterium]
MQNQGHTYGAFRGWFTPLLLVCGVAVLFMCAADAVAQEAQATEGMQIKRVEINGLTSISEAYLRRIIKTRAGQPFVRRDVEEDVRELLRSRKFIAAFANTRVEDGEAVVIFTVQEKPEVVSVEIEGNKKFDDAQLYELTPVAGAPLDRYEISRARDDIEQKYKEAGYYYVEVTLDERALAQEGRVVYRITEGPRVKVRHLRFEGNRAYGDRRLKTKIETKAYIWIFRKGTFDEERADRDAIHLQQYYRDEGYLDARVGYRLEFDEVQREDLDLVFVLEEGPRYRIRDITCEGNEVFPDDRLRAAMKLTPGKHLRQETLHGDLKRLRNMYGEIGYVALRLDSRADFLEEPGLVTLRVLIVENVRSRFGRITIRGNQQTKDEVIRRELRFYPGEYYNTVEVRKAAQRLRETWLFTPEGIEITPLKDINGIREALVTVEETETTTFLIGVGVSTDSGVIGSLSIDNRNFDLFDWPLTWGEFFRGRAFKGDGQRLLFQAEPGTEVSRFRISFTEPYLLDRPMRLDTSVYLFQRGREAYDEQRLGATVSLSKRFRGGIFDGWAIEGATRIEGIEIDDLDPFAARDIREAKGNHFLTAVKGAIVRDTTDSRLLPTEGYRLSFSWEQVGVLGGDHDFGKPALGFAWYKTLRTDILDRKSVFAVRADAAYIVGQAPVFERFYAGGFGSLRGFSFRGVSPRSGIFNNVIGGNFILLTGGEYSFPLYGKNFRGVTFMDMGTVEEGFEITDWRVSVGFGLRIQVDFFGPVPIVFDFGFPLTKNDDDDTQVFNFAFGASF